MKNARVFQLNLDSNWGQTRILSPICTSGCRVFADISARVHSSERKLQGIRKPSKNEGETGKTKQLTKIEINRRRTEEGNKEKKSEMKKEI
jgi:hypothetical protein